MCAQSEWTGEPLILASASPRRREILTLLGLPFEVEPAPGEAAPAPDWTPEQAVLRIARDKAEQVARLRPDRVVVGADTVVVLDGGILGKPADERDAARMLTLLQGREHTVMTGVWVCAHGRADGFVEQADVSFYPMTRREIEEYVHTGEPMDKAGAYGIQGAGMRYVRGIRGDFYTVMGLPGARLWRFLRNFGK